MWCWMEGGAGSVPWGRGQHDLKHPRRGWGLVAPWLCLARARPRGLQGGGGLVLQAALPAFWGALGPRLAPPMSPPSLAFSILWNRAQAQEPLKTFLEATLKTVFEIGGINFNNVSYLTQ